MKFLRCKANVQGHRFRSRDGREGELWLEEIKGYLNRLTFETMGSIVAGEKGLTPAITQVAVTISDPDLALPVSVALVAEPHAH